MHMTIKSLARGKGSNRERAVLSRYGRQITKFVYLLPGHSLDRIKNECNKMISRGFPVKIEITKIFSDNYSEKEFFP